MAAFSLPFPLESGIWLLLTCMKACETFSFDPFEIGSPLLLWDRVFVGAVVVVAWLMEVFCNSYDPCSFSFVIACGF